MATTTTSESTSQIATESAREVSRFRKILKTTAWIALALFCLVLFTVLKLPEDRIRNLVQGSISSALSPQGITLNAAKSWISVGFGVSYTMKDVTVNFPPPQAPIQIEKISFSPYLFQMLFGRMGGKLSIENKDGWLNASFTGSRNLIAPPAGSKSGTTPPSSKVALSFESKNIDIGRLGVLPLLANVHGSAVLTGSGNLEGDANVPSTFVGEVKADLNKLVIDEQNVMGFGIPKLTISEGKIDIGIDKGKAVFRTFRLGKPGSATDDLIGNISGDAVLGKSWDSTLLSLKSSFTLSQNVQKAIPLIDALLGAGKQPDGSYAFNLSGPIGSPTAMPAGTAK